MRFRLAIALSTSALGMLALPGVARADGYVAAGIGPTWIARAPAIAMTEPLEIDSRTVPKGDIANRGGLVMFGGYLDGGFVFGDRWMIPLFGLGFHSAIGSSDEVLSSRDGSIATLRPWSAYSVDALLPGFGVRAKKRRWMFEADVRTGLGVIWEGGSVVGGAETSTFEGAAVSFLLMGHVMGCRRLDPEQRLCLEVMPRIYEFGWWNGATVGLRYEAGR